ncbi:hypothetical protein OROGR_022287 [Orobanche gracilis]
MAVCDLPRRRFRRCPAVTISIESADGVRFERTGRSSLTVRRGSRPVVAVGRDGEEVDMIVVTDGAGFQGIGTAIRKVDLYVAAAGKNPQREGWLASRGTLEEVKAKIQMRQDSAVKR